MCITLSTATFLIKTLVKEELLVQLRNTRVYLIYRKLLTAFPSQQRILRQLIMTTPCHQFLHPRKLYNSGLQHHFVLTTLLFLRSLNLVLECQTHTLHEELFYRNDKDVLDIFVFFSRRQFKQNPVLETFCEK